MVDARFVVVADDDGGEIMILESADNFP